MKDLVDGYIAYKRSLGYKIKTEAETLRRFASSMEDEGYDGPMCAEAAIRWIDGFGEPSEWYRARLYETLRTFSRYASVVDADSTVLPKGSGICHGRTDPYIYSDSDAATMMDALGGLYSPDGLRARSLRTMFGLMYSSGLRPSECVSMEVGDYDRGSGVITVQSTKFNRQRLVPLSDSAAAAMERHISGLPASGRASRVFLRTGAKPFDVRAVEYGWQLARGCLLERGEEWGRRPPRPYDCRHSFCIHALERWLSAGLDVNTMMPYLSIYMGHSKITDTYWYLTATPALLDRASDIFWGHVGGGAHE